MPNLSQIKRQRMLDFLETLKKEHTDDESIDRNDTFRHSKWISFMTTRLKIARELLSEKGLLFVSIDDNELSAKNGA